MTPPDGRKRPLDLRLKVGVLIAPTRDRNTSAAARSRRSASCPHRPYKGSQPHGAVSQADVSGRPHRPYEGSQQGDGAEGVLTVRSSSPLRGIAT